MVNKKNNNYYNKRVPGAAAGSKTKRIPATSVDTFRGGTKETLDINVVGESNCLPI